MTRRRSERTRRNRPAPSGPEISLAQLVAGVEEAFSVRHGVMLERLREIESAIESRTDGLARGVREQVAFIRVGLRCIADAVGELDAHACAADEGLASDRSGRGDESA